MSSEESFVLPSKRKVQEDLPGAITHFEKLRKLITEVEREDTRPVKCHYHDEWMYVIPDIARMVVEYARGDCKSGFKQVLFGYEPPLYRITRRPCCSDKENGVYYDVCADDTRSFVSLDSKPVITEFKNCVTFRFQAENAEFRVNRNDWLQAKLTKNGKVIEISGRLQDKSSLEALFQDDPRATHRSFPVMEWEYDIYGRITPLSPPLNEGDILRGLRGLR